MIEETLVSILKGFNYDVKRSVFEPNTDTDVYFVLNIDTVPIDFGDDTPVFEKYLVQIHLYAPLNVDVTELVRSVKRELFTAGFDYPNTEDASDENGRHIVMETENVEEIEDAEI